MSKRKRRSPRKHEVHPKHSRYYVTQYNRGVPMTVSSLPEGAKPTSEDRVHDWEGTGAQGNFSHLGQRYNIRATAFSKPSAQRYAKKLRDERGVKVAIRGKYNRIFNRIEYVIGSKAPSFNEITREADAKGSTRIVYGEWEYKKKNGEWVQTRSHEGIFRYKVFKGTKSKKKVSKRKISQQKPKTKQRKDLEKKYLDAYYEAWGSTPHPRVSVHGMSDNELKGNTLAINEYIKKSGA